MANHPRFFPGPQGKSGLVVVPMTDFSLKAPDGHNVTDEAVRIATENTGRMRQLLLTHKFVPGGSKFASDMSLEPGDPNAADMKIKLHGGATLGDEISFHLRLPHTPGTKAGKPQTIDELFQIICNKMMGGNISNVYRTMAHLSCADLGAETHEVFSPPDKYLDDWLSEKLTPAASKRLNVHELVGIDARIGLALPYMNQGKVQQFSFNRPQGLTVDPMEPHVNALHNLDHLVVSEGIGVLLAKYNVDLTQVYNPTSALHTHSALEMYDRIQAGNRKDVTIINADEMELWIKTMENRRSEEPIKELPDAKFPSLFRTDDPDKIDEGAFRVSRDSHSRFRALSDVSETEYVSMVMGVGCGPEGGQNQFQGNGKRYVAAASTLSDEGAKRLLAECGDIDPNLINLSIRDSVGAGDAACTASLIARLYAPLEQIIDLRCPNMSNDRKRIAAMAFTTILQRVFGELAYRSKLRDLSVVPAEAFPRIFDKTLDKAIAAAQKLTTIERVPTNVYHDPEWDVRFTAMELEK
jgi:hypothetical protein